MSLTIEALGAWANLLMSFAALIVAIIALVYTIEAYLLKKGHRIRCSYGVGGSVDSDDHHVHHLLLENLKDRSSVIFKVYLRFGHNIYLQLEDFENDPLILKPFEVYSKVYDPVLFYTEGSELVKLNKLLSDHSLKKRIILSTTDGKYEAEVNGKMWSTVSTFFENYSTLIVRPSRLEYNGKSYGSNIKYLIIFKSREGNEHVVPVNQEFKYAPRFMNYKLTEEACESKETLEAFLLSQKEAGNITFESIKVIDFSEHVLNQKQRFKGDPIVAEPYGFFQYRVVGRIFTLRENLKLGLKNWKSMRKYKKLLTKK